MAIISDVIDERGHVYAQQYINVHRLLVKKTSMEIEVAVHESADTAGNGVPPHRVETIIDVPFNMDAKLNAWQQAYVAIKQRWPQGTDA